MTSGGKEFYPLENWDHIELQLFQQEGLSPFPVSQELDASSLQMLCSQINAAFLKVSSIVQKESEWIPAKETISRQHKVELSLTPNGMQRSIALTLNMGLKETGLEDKLMGKSVQSVPFKISFIAAKVNAKHPLFPYSGQQLSGTIAINNVFKPPFKLKALPECEDNQQFEKELLDLLRAVPFHLASEFGEHLRKETIEHSQGKDILGGILIFLEHHAQTSVNFKQNLLSGLLELGSKFDPEMEMSYTETLYIVYSERKNRFHPQAFQQQINTCFEQRFSEILTKVISQLSQQQKDIRLRLTNYSEVEGERQRLIALAQDLEEKKRGKASEEVLRRSRQDISKLAQRIQKRVRQFESSKGIILIQELYLAALEKAPHLQACLKRQQGAFKDLKTSLQANHISASRDIESLTHSLGVHASHLMVQHAIYSEVEPDLTQVVSVECLKQYDPKVIAPLLNLMPSLREEMQGKELNSHELLRAVLDTELSDREKNAFKKFCDDNPEPKHNEVQRFTQQTQQFLSLSEMGDGVEGIAHYVKSEVLCLQSVLRFAAEQNKLNTDLKNHLKYYDQVFLDPYLNLLEQTGHEDYEDIDRAYGKVNNAMKVTMEIRYTCIEEKALLSMFRHINGQLQNENLFAAAIFTKQIKQFMIHLNQYKNKVPAALMKRILETYTVFMMGSSRTRNLSKEKGALSGDQLSKIRATHSSLIDTP